MPQDEGNTDYVYDPAPEIMDESYDSVGEDTFGPAAGDEPELSRKARRERETEARREQNSRAAKRARRKAENETPPDDLPPLPVRSRRSTETEEEAPKKRRRRSSEAPITPDAPAPRGSWKLPVIIVCIVLLLLLALVVTGALLVHRIDTIYPGVSIEGIDLSGLTRNEARDTLLALGHERYDGYAVTADLPLGNTLAMSAADAGMRFSADAAADAAWSYGRGDGLFGALVKYIQCRYLGKCGFAYESDPFTVTLDETKMRNLVETKAADIDAQLLESSIVIGEDTITLLKGASGMTLDTESILASFRDAFLSGDTHSFVYESAPNTDETFDFQALYNDIYSEVAEAEILYNPDIETTGSSKDGDAGEEPEATPAPSDAPDTSDAPGSTPEPTDVSQIDFNGEPFIVTQSSVGRTFDIAAAEAAWADAAYGDTVTIPMTVTKPEHSTEELNALLFRDELSKNWTMVRLWNRDYCNEVRTSLSGSSDNRISNVKKACELLDGMVLIPGQTFSFNDALGERTEENGWKPATAYANGEVRQEYGGGICQVSSTLYNAVLYANLEIVERACHQFQVGYLPWGMDATVSWGWPDLKFRNDAEYPIKIHAWVDDEENECCIQILGTDVDHQYVLMQFNNWEVFDETGTYYDASGNPLSVGMAAATWRLVFNDGDDYNTATPISKKYEAYSTYNYHTEDIQARHVPQG